MNPLNDNDPARQAARSWSQQLGSLAAASSAVQPEASFMQPDAASPAAVPANLSAIFARLWQRARSQEHAAHKLLANEFMTGT